MVPIDDDDEDENYGTGKKKTWVRYSVHYAILDNEEWCFYRLKMAASC